MGAPCDILVYRRRHQSMWSTRLVGSNLLSICVITRHWNHFLTQKCFSVESLNTVSVNTVIAIIAIIQRPKVAGCLHKRTIYSHSVLVTFINVVFRVMRTTYWHKPDFSVVMYLSRPVDSLSFASAQDIVYLVNSRISTRISWVMLSG